MALSLSSRLTVAAALMVVPLVLATTFALLGRYFWLLDLFVHFTVQYTASFAVALALALLARSRHLTVMAAAGLAINGLQVALPFPVAATERLPQAALDLRIVTYNVFLGRQHDRRVTEFLAASEADIIVLQEFPAADAPALLAALPGFSHWTAAGAAMTQGAVILSRWPIKASTAVPLSDQPTHVTRAEITAKGRDIVVYGAHLQWPLVPHLAVLRDKEMEALAREVAQCTGACIVVGDLNTTPWSSHFRKLLEAGGLSDCASRQPLLTSWPTFLAPARIRIDHCLVNDRWRVRRADRGPSLGSDHFPMIYDLSLINGASAGETHRKSEFPLAPVVQTSKAP